MDGGAKDGGQSSVQSLSRVQLFVTPWTAARQASLSITNSWNLLKLMSIESVMPSNHLILCHPLLLLPSIFPTIRIFSNESVLRIRWPKVDDLSPFKFVETCLILHTTRAVFLNLALSACGENKVISLVSLLMRPLIPFMEASPS